MRSTATVIGLGIACAVLSSCGHSHGFNAAQAKQSAPGARSSNPATGQLTRPQAVAFARAVNLRSDDLPGFSASARRNRETQAEKRLGRQLLRCVGAVAENGLAEVGSGDFERRGLGSVLSVASNVSVTRTSALAARELSRLRSGRSRRCVASYFRQLLQIQHLGSGTLGPVSVQHGTPPAPGAAGGFAWRISATLTVHVNHGRLRSVRAPFYIDILGFVYGPAEVTLFSFGTPVPFPAAAQQHLYTLLLARAKLTGTRG